MGKGVQITNIRAAYSLLPPFVSEVNEKGTISLGGFMPSILESIAQWMNFSLTFVKEPDDQYGSLVNNTWTGMCGMLVRNEVDIILNPIMPREDLFDYAFYTNPLMIEAYTFLSGKSKEEAGLFLYFSVLAPLVWGSVLLSLLLVATTSMLIYKSVRDSRRLPWPQTWWEYLWFFWSAMLSQAPNEKWILRQSKYKVSVLTSLLVTFWTFGVAFLVMNVFRSRLVSKLTIVKSEPLIKSMEDFVYKKGIKAATAREIEIHEVLNDSGIPLYEGAWERVKNNLMPMSLLFSDQVLDDVERGKITMIHGHLILEDVLNTRFEERGTCNFYVVKQQFFPFSLHMVIRKTLPKNFLNRFNIGISRLLSADLTGKWFKSINRGYQLCVSYQDNTLKPLNIKNLYGVFIIWSIGICVSLVTLSCEILHNRHLTNSKKIRQNCHCKLLHKNNLFKN